MSQSGSCEVVPLGQPASGAVGKGYSRLNVYPELVVELMSLRMQTQSVHACSGTVLIPVALIELSGVQLCVHSVRYDELNSNFFPGRMRRNLSRQHRNHRRDEPREMSTRGIDERMLRSTFKQK